jgi:hypothetical protein
MVVTALSDKIQLAQDGNRWRYHTDSPASQKISSLRVLFPVVKYNGIDHGLEWTTTKGSGTSEGIIADPSVEHTALRPPRKQRKAS